MYLAIDIGGTKTLVATFDTTGQKIAQEKFPTPQDYNLFLSDLEKTVAKISTESLTICVCAVPGLIDRERGIIESLGNLPWRNKPIRDDISRAIDNTEVIIENDAKLAGIAEATHLVGQYERVLYLTVSTGIGGALLKNGQIIEELRDTEAGKMPLQYEGKFQAWESFGSGKAIVERYQKRASEIEDIHIWKDISLRVGYGTAICCSIMQPDVIVFGGGVGQFADKFSQGIVAFLQTQLHPNIRQPKALLPPHYGEESVIQGCFMLLKQLGKL